MRYGKVERLWIQNGSGNVGVFNVQKLVLNYRPEGYDEKTPLGPRYIEVISIEDHDRIVAELKASIEHSETKVGWLLHDNEKNVREHERVVAEKDVAYNNLDDVNMALNEKIAKQAKVIEKLKNMIPHYEECKKLDASDYADDDDIPCDCGIDKEIAAIENLK